MLQTSQLFDGARQRFLDALLAAARIEVYLPNVGAAGACVSWGGRHVCLLDLGCASCSRRPSCHPTQAYLHPPLP